VTDTWREGGNRAAGDPSRTDQPVMTDPRAALAEPRWADRHQHEGVWFIREPERGVLLVRKELREAVQAVADYSWGLHLAGTPNEQEAIALIERLRAALSGEGGS
jgi:hypothetical protein